MANWYRTGVVTLNQGVATVSGVGTYWETAANKPAKGDLFTRDNQTIYEIISVDSDDQIMLDRPYEGTYETSASYAIIRSGSSTTNARVASQVSAVLEALGDRVTVSTTAPSSGQGKNGDIWIVASGA